MKKFYYFDSLLHCRIIFQSDDHESQDTLYMDVTRYCIDTMIIVTILNKILIYNMNK